MSNAQTDNANVPTRIAVVTGASRGIGAATALLLAAQGRHVVLMARNEEKLRAVKQQIEDAGGKAEVRPCDVSDHVGLAAIIEDIAKAHKRLDILVNNAGITRDNLLLRMSDEEWDQIMQVNLRSAFVTCRAAARAMMRGKFGRIVNIGSVSGIVGNAGQCNYAAAKAALVGMTRSISKELATKGVTANVVAPGFVETDMTDVLPDSVKESVVAAIPARRMGRAEEIAAAVGFLTSEDAGYVTGQVLTVDGGMTSC